MSPEDRVYVAGHRGLVGSALLRRLRRDGPLEPTNQPYAVANIAGIELCHAYRRQYGANFARERAAA